MSGKKQRLPKYQYLIDHVVRERIGYPLEQRSAQLSSPATPFQNGSAKTPLPENAKIRKDHNTQKQQQHSRIITIANSQLKAGTDQEAASINRIDQFSSKTNLQLDPRDQKVVLPFQSSYYLEMESSGFQISYEPFEDELREWLVDLIEITTSIGFNHLKKETLIEKQAKTFVSKNILDNIKAVFERYHKIPLEAKFNLMKFINAETYQIFEHVAKKYPLTSTKGVSKRIKSKVQKIDNRESEEFDFLIRNNIHIKYRSDGDYSEDIMKIINKLISFSTDSFDNSMELQETNFEIFTQLMEYVFENANSQTPNITAKELVRLLHRKKNKIDQEMGQLNKCPFFDSDQMQIVQKQSQDTKRLVKESPKHVLIGQKIPIGVPQFTEQEIECSNFKTYDSSILRLLTKWAEELRNKIVNAQDNIYRRMFKFKDNNGRLINVEPLMKEELYEAAIIEIEKIQTYLQELKNQNYYLQTLFAEEINKGKYAKHDTRVGIFAAKLNQTAGQYIFKYINRLIHSLLTIPRVAAEKLTNDRQKALLSSVNLVTFKIGDLMRCKCSCSEQQFINILKVLDVVHTRSPQVLKIVRIKNRLQTQNNDILINLFFGNKAQCELQLSVLSNQKKHEKNSSIFCHLIYEIIRAQLGPISEMANIVVQYDPLIHSYSKKAAFGPELVKKRKIKAQQEKQLKEKQQQRDRFKSKNNLNLRIELPFVCSTCSKLAIVHNPQFFFRDFSSPARQCNSCIHKNYVDQWCSTGIRYQIFEDVLAKNFENQARTFYRSHMVFWDQDKFMHQIENDFCGQKMSFWFPTYGFMIRHNQKKPILELFTSIYDQNNSEAIFAKIDEKGNKKVLASIKVHCEKNKRMKAIKKELQKFVILQLTGHEYIQQDNFKYFKCNKQGCCGLKVLASPAIQKQKLIQCRNRMRVQNALQNQQVHLNLNYIPKSLEKLENYIRTVSQKNKLWKIRNTVLVVQAFNCNLENINVINIFAQLTDLNIGNNLAIRDLKGIQKCFNLKYLDCKNCDLQNIDELVNIRKLQELNLTNNKRLNSIKSLQKHTQLLNVYLNNTAVSSLSPLSKCFKLQSLDLQGCREITTVKDIHSISLRHISLINCLSIQQLDLPPLSLKSLRNIELYKTDIQIMMANLVANFSVTQLTQNLRSQKSEQTINPQTLSKINNILKIRRTMSA